MEGVPDCTICVWVQIVQRLVCLQSTIGTEELKLSMVVGGHICLLSVVLLESRRFSKCLRENW